MIRPASHRGAAHLEEGRAPFPALAAKSSCLSHLHTLFFRAVERPWAALPLVESAGGMVNLPRWTVCASRPRPPPTGPLCGTSPDGQWSHVENKVIAPHRHTRCHRCRVPLG